MRLGDLGGGDPKRVQESRLVGSNLGERAWEMGGQAGRDGWASGWWRETKSRTERVKKFVLGEYLFWRWGNLWDAECARLTTNTILRLF